MNYKTRKELHEQREDIETIVVKINAVHRALINIMGDDYTAIENMSDEEKKGERGQRTIRYATMIDDIIEALGKAETLIEFQGTLLQDIIDD